MAEHIVDKIEAKIAEQRYLEKIQELERATQQENLDKVSELLEQLPASKRLPKPFSEVVKKARRTYILRTTRNDVRKLIKATEAYDIETIRTLLGKLPSSKNMPRPYKQFIQDAEHKLKKEEQRQERMQHNGELDLDLSEENPFSINGIEDLYSKDVLRYKRIVDAVESLVEDGNEAKAAELLTNITIGGAPNEVLEERVRGLKERLNVKYRKK